MVALGTDDSRYLHLARQPLDLELIAAVAVAYWAGRRVDAAAYDDSAEDHIACPLAYPEGTAYDPARAAQSLASPFEHIVDAVGQWHGIYHVIDAQMCPYNGRTYAHVVIRGNGQTLSLFAERAECGALPAMPTTVLAGDTLDVHATARLGYQISAVATRDHRLFLVSEWPTDPPDFAQDILCFSLPPGGELPQNRARTTDVSAPSKGEGAERVRKRALC